MQLTTDHTANDPSEQRKLASLHPGEEDIVLCHSQHACYVKGRLMPTRSLGDFHLKRREVEVTRDGRTSSVVPRYGGIPFTPPYITAEPDITTVELGDDYGAAFIVLGSDGVWEVLSNERVVEIVAGYSATPESRAAAAGAVVEAALLQAAHESGMSIDQLKALPPGRARRSRHDDITVIVHWFEDAKPAAAARRE